MNTKNTLLFEWSEAMCLGIAEIDAQHQELVNLLNRLFVSVVQQDKDAITVQILDALLDYTKTHFVLEEHLMRKARYNAEDYVAHKQAHQNFIDKISHSAQKNLAEGKSVSFELIHFLKCWLRNHILVADKQYAETVIAAKVAGAAAQLQQSSTTTSTQAVAPTPWWKIW